MSRGFQKQKCIDMMTMRANIITIQLHIMNTRETLILKTLQYKAFLNGTDKGGMVDALLEQNPEQADQITKNVCARIPSELAQRMESLGDLLGLNKREMITMALKDFLDKASDTIDEFDAYPEGV